VTVGRRRVKRDPPQNSTLSAARLAADSGFLRIFDTISCWSYSSLSAACCHEGRSQIRLVPMSKQLCVTPGIVDLTPKCTEQSFEAAWDSQGSEWFRSPTVGQTWSPRASPDAFGFCDVLGIAQSSGVSLEILSFASLAHPGRASVQRGEPTAGHLAITFQDSHKIHRLSQLASITHTSSKGFF
jgi:hypothetical protein